VKSAVGHIPKLRGNSLRALAFMAVIAVALVALATWFPKGTAADEQWSLGESGSLGKATATDIATVSAARYSGVSVDTVRQVVETSSAERTLELLSGQNAAHDTCFAARVSAGSNVLSSQQFQCLEDRAVEKPVIYALTGGGSKPDVVTRIELAGVARDDVARVELTLATGTQLDLPLNQWRGFGYSADEGDALPRALKAYDSADKVIFDADVSAFPLQ
jgi:hypothetical protein